MAWCRPGNKPLSEPMMVSLLTHICVTRSQWYNYRVTFNQLNSTADVLVSSIPSSEQPPCRPDYDCSPSNIITRCLYRLNPLNMVKRRWFEGESVRFSLSASTHHQTHNTSWSKINPVKLNWNMISFVNYLIFMINNRRLCNAIRWNILVVLTLLVARAGYFREI